MSYKEQWQNERYQTYYKHFYNPGKYDLSLEALSEKTLAHGMAQQQKIGRVLRPFQERLYFPNSLAKRLIDLTRWRH